VGLSDKPELQN